jgi:hypothetical protein
VITLGDHALVFSALRRVTCGVAVHMAVDNRRDVRITRGILWRTCGQEKTLNEFRQALARRGRRAVEILSPQETGTIWGFPPGRGKGRETGIYRRCLAPAGGVWRRGVWETGRTGIPGNLGNWANRNSEAGRPVDLDRGGWETSRSGTVRPGDWRTRSREAGKLADPGP